MLEQSLPGKHCRIVTFPLRISHKFLNAFCKLMIQDYSSKAEVYIKQGDIVRQYFYGEEHGH